MLVELVVPRLPLLVDVVASLSHWPWSVASKFGESRRRDDLLRKEQVIMRWNAGCGHEPQERNLGVESG